jgi:hypothetical protein
VTGRSNQTWRLGALVVACLSLAACTSASRTRTITTTRESTVHSTVTETTQAPPMFKPKPAATVAPLVPGQPPAAGETEKACPYILSTQDQGPDSLADLEGDRVYRTTVLTRMSPVGCRFYFYAPPFEAIAEIAARTFTSSLAAHDAMVLTGQAGTQVAGKPNIVPGVDAVLYRTKFFGPDGARDWACVFAKGKVMVTVRTQRTDTSLNALLIARTIAPKIG